MKSKNCQFNPKKRRGLSSVVGALLFVVLMVATFSVLGVALNTQTDIVSTARDVSNIDLKKQQEAFDIIAIAQEAGDFLEIKVINKGQNPAEIFTLVITNKTDAGEPTTTYEIPSDTSFLAPGKDDPTNVVETLDLNMTLAANPGDPAKEYDIKIISSLGTIKKLKLFCTDINCGIGGGTGTGTLKVQLFLDGPTGINTKTSTIIMIATNTGDGPMTGVEPTEGITVCADILESATGTGAITNCQFESDSPATLVAGQSAFFIWDGTITGDIGDVLTFCNNAFGFDPVLVNGPPPDPCDTLEIIDPNDCGGCADGGDDDIRE